MRVAYGTYANAEQYQHGDKAKRDRDFAHSPKIWLMLPLFLVARLSDNANRYSSFLATFRLHRREHQKHHANKQKTDLLN